MLSRTVALTISFQRVDVRQVLPPAGCAFVGDQLISTHEGNVEWFHFMCHSRHPSVLESKPGDAGHDVDSAWRKANLDDHPGTCEILDGYSKDFDPSAEL